MSNRQDRRIGGSCDVLIASLFVQSWAERAYPDNLLHYHRLDRGSHLATWQQPPLLAQELRTAFRPLR